MADILLYNALKEVNKTLSINSGLGLTETEIKTAVSSAVTNNTPVAAFTPLYELEKLSCVNLISHCLCNYAGSGTGGVTSGSLWGTMTPASSVSLVGKLYTKLSGTTQMASIVKVINSLDSNLKNEIIQYIELYAVGLINALPQTTKDKWYDTAGSFKVCSANYNAGEGATCTWTVPAGVTKAKFQVWGAGSGTNPGCCCGGSPFGATGAFAELVVGVTAGQQYVICAGCSCAINCCSNTYPGCACMSGVTGPNICCLKADGGASNGCCVLNCASTLLGTYTCYRYNNIYCYMNSGACWCSYGEYCFGGSCASCGVIAVHPNCTSTGAWCACGTTTTQVSKDGYRSLHGGGCFDTNHYGYMVRPPILDADTCANSTTGCACATYTSENCTGGYLGDTWPKHPGQGGAYTHVMAGANQHYGGKGAGGMVKVTWA